MTHYKMSNESYVYWKVARVVRERARVWGVGCS